MYNVTPYKQTNLTPIFNLTSQAYDDKMDIYVRSNQTFNACVNVTFSNTSKKDDGFKLNTSYQMISHNLSLSGGSGVWNYADARNCSGRFIVPYYYYVSACSNCTITGLTDMDDFYLLVG